MHASRAASKLGVDFVFVWLCARVGMLGRAALLLLLRAVPPSAQNAAASERKHRFEEGYTQNLWSSRESRSGIGSERPNALADMRFILSIVRKRFGRGHPRANVTIVDVPCGDMNWMPELLGQLEKEFAVSYYGYDIVPQAINAHRSTFSSHPNWHFLNVDVVKRLPTRGDVLISRDLVNHLPLADVQRALSNIKATHSPTLIISNNRDARVNEEVHNAGGGSRMLDIERPPFNWKRAIAGSANGHMWLWDDSTQVWTAADVKELSSASAGVKEWPTGGDAAKQRAKWRRDDIHSRAIASHILRHHLHEARPNSTRQALTRWAGVGAGGPKRRGRGPAGAPKGETERPMLLGLVAAAAVFVLLWVGAACVLTWGCAWCSFAFGVVRGTAGKLVS